MTEEEDNFINYLESLGNRSIYSFVFLFSFFFLEKIFTTFLNDRYEMAISDTSWEEDGEE